MQSGKVVLGKVVYSTVQVCCPGCAERERERDTMLEAKAFA